LSTLPVVGGLAFSLEEQRARAAKRDHARLRFERRNDRLLREEQQKQAEREARAKRAAQPEATASDPVQAALERVRAQKTATADAALKKAKIDVAMSRAQLHKSLKAFGHPPTFEQQSQLIVLQQQFEAAEQALAQLESNAPAVAAPAPAKDADLKRAKIQLAMRRAELKKAQTAEASPEQIAALEHALRDAEQALHDAEATSDQPVPDLVRVEKRPIDSQLRQLKTELAYARADLNKLERRADTPDDILDKARARLQTAERQVQDHVAP
jgi:electron transport complex protein RnfB